MFKNKLLPIICAFSIYNGISAMENPKDEITLQIANQSEKLVRIFYEVEFRQWHGNLGRMTGIKAKDDTDLKLPFIEGDDKNQAYLEILGYILKIQKTERISHKVQLSTIVGDKAVPVQEKDFNTAEQKLIVIIDDKGSVSFAINAK